MASPATTASPTYNVQYSPSAQSNCPQTYNVVLGNPNENLGLDYTELPGGRLEISYVPPGTAAGRAGVPRGELVAVGDVPVRSTNELKRAVEDYKARGQLTIPLQVVMEKYPLPIVDIPSRLNRFQVEGMQYIRVFEKISSKGRPSERALCLGKNHLLLCTVDTAQIKRLIKMDEIESVHHFVNANGPQETLIKCFPPEHDVFLKHSMPTRLQQPRPSMDELKKMTDALKAVFHHVTGRDLHVVESATSLAGNAHLSKRQGYTEPKQKLKSISVQKYKKPVLSVAGSPVQSPQQHPAVPESPPVGATAQQLQHPPSFQSYHSRNSATSVPAPPPPALPPSAPAESLPPPPPPPEALPPDVPPLDTAPPPLPVVAVSVPGKEAVATAAAPGSEGPQALESQQPPKQPPTPLGSPLQPRLVNDPSSHTSRQEQLAAFLGRAAYDTSHPSHIEAASDLGHKLLRGDWGYPLRADEGIRLLKLAAAAGDVRAQQTLDSSTDAPPKPHPVMQDKSTLMSQPLLEQQQLQTGQAVAVALNRISRNQSRGRRRSTENLIDAEDRLRKRESDLSKRWDDAMQNLEANTAVAVTPSRRTHRSAFTSTTAGGMRSGFDIQAGSSPPAPVTPNRVTTRLTPGEPITMMLEVHLDSPSLSPERADPNFDFKACYKEI